MWGFVWIDLVHGSGIRSGGIGKVPVVFQRGVDALMARGIKHPVGNEAVGPYTRQTASLLCFPVKIAGD